MHPILQRFAHMFECSYLHMVIVSSGPLSYSIYMHSSMYFIKCSKNSKTKLSPFDEDGVLLRYAAPIRLSCVNYHALRENVHQRNITVISNLF